MTEQTIENVRRQTRALRPIYLEDLGLVTALEMLAREASQAGDIPVEFQRQGTETFAGWNMYDMRFAASMLKITAMFAAFRLRHNVRTPDLE